MTLFYMVFQDLKGRKLGSLLIGFFVLALTGFLSLSTVILWGTEENLRTGKERLGANIVVVPYDVTERAQTEVLAGGLAKGDSMPADHVRRISGMEAVKRASPQLYLSAIEGSPYSTADELLIVAFDPETDFTILPWLQDKPPKPLRMGDAIGGALVNKIGPPERVLVKGYRLTLVNKLEPTGIWLDQALFISFDTARDMRAQGAISSEVSLDTVTAIAVDLKPGHDIARTATEMLFVAPGIWPVQATKLMADLGAQRKGLMRSLFFSLGIIWMLGMVLSGFVFSLAADERRREIGVLRAAGASRRFIFRLFLTEGVMLASAGAFTGMILSALLLYFLRTWLTNALDMRVILPSLSGLAAMTVGCFLTALVLVFPAFLYPAIRASRIDPAVAMREV